MEHAIIKLQEMLSHHADEIAQLSGELRVQQKEIQQLRAQVARLEAKLGAVLDQGSMVRPLEEETPPPHY